MILIASFARTFKEGQGYLSPFFLICSRIALAASKDFSRRTSGGSSSSARAGAVESIVSSRAATERGPRGKRFIENPPGETPGIAGAPRAERAFGENRQLTTRDIARELDAIVPLYSTYEEKIKALREWAKSRTRRASVDQSLVDLFESE